MTEVITNIFKTQTTITKANSTDSLDSNPLKITETKCGEIILLAKTNFWFVCDFCQDRFVNVFLFLDHIKDKHIPDTVNDSSLAQLNLDQEDEKSSIDLDARPASRCSEDAESIKDEKRDTDTDVDKKSECKEIVKSVSTKIKVLKKRGRKKKIQEPPGDSTAAKDEEASVKSEDKNEETNLNEQTTTEDVGKEKEKDAEDEGEGPSEPKKVRKKYYRKKNIFPCPKCDAKITDGRSLQKHIRSHNEGGNENRFQCEECGKCYKNSFNLKTHSIIHSGTRPFKCEFCDVGFSHPNSLKTHRFLHTGERPYKCDQCDKSFVSNSSRKVHMRQHTGETPFVCQYCGKGYTIKSNFDIHVRRHTGQRDFQCNQCNKGFFNKETLVNHIACHTGEKNFVCDVCSNRFARRKDLVEHRKLHLDHKYYSCKVCGKEFSQYSGLYSHMRQHKNKDK